MGVSEKEIGSSSTRRTKGTNATNGGGSVGKLVGFVARYNAGGSRSNGYGWSIWDNECNVWRQRGKIIKIIRHECQDTRYLPHGRGKRNDIYWATT